MTGHSTYPWTAPTSAPAAALAGQLGAQVPTLRTQRLILRAPVLSDFEPYADILMSDTSGFMGGPFTRDSAWLDFTNYVAGWLLRGAGLWTLQHRHTGSGSDAVLGFVTMGMEPGDAENELGYLLTKEARGLGYATEAATAVRDFAFDVHGLPSLVSYIDPGHAASVRVATRLGAQRDHTAEAGFDAPVHVYRHAPDDNDGNPEAYA